MADYLRDYVRITDVAPRDGLQNESNIIATDRKFQLIKMLAASGVDEVEVTSFVSPKWVPQLGDAEPLMALVSTLGTSTMLSALVPNDKGMDAALRTIDHANTQADRAHKPSTISKVSVFTAASETFAQKNTGASIAQTIERFVPVIARAKQRGLLVRGYVSTVIACPFEGAIPPEAVARVCDLLKEIGVDEIDLGDTIGAGTPESIGKVLREVRHTLTEKWWGAQHMTLHLHDTFGQAGSCVLRALELGVRSFDASAGGLGGCPFASTPDGQGGLRKAPGNISTQTLVEAIEKFGCSTRVDKDQLAKASVYARSLV
jgi:hydroxymethylglutaryl-CoA lyase